MKKRMIPELILSLKGYNSNLLLKDIIAGIIVGIIALPLSIALAIASGAQPAAGLVTAIFAGASAALFGGSKTQISGPTGAFVVIVAGIIGTHGTAGLLLATLMAGFFIIIMGVARLGKYVRYIPLPVIVGFTIGIAVTIFITQLNDFLGLGLGGVPSQTLPRLFYIFKHISSLSFLTLGMGCLAIAIIVIVPKVQKLMPGPLIAIILCTIVNLLLPVKSVTLGDIFGTIDINIKLNIFSFELASIPSLIVPALTIAFLAAVESLLSAVVADGMTHTKHNSNMELVGQGCANIFSAMFGGLPATGAIARTSANIKNGGRTPISALVHSIVILLLSLFLMPYAKFIPMSVFAAILIVVCYNMVDIKEVKKICKTTPVDIGLMVTTFALTVIFDLVVAILVCTSLSLLYQAYIKLIKKHKGSKEDSADCIKLKGVVSYMNYERLLDTNSQSLTLDIQEVIDIDATFTDFLIKKTKRNHIKIINPNKKLFERLIVHPEFAYLKKENSFLL